MTACAAKAAVVVVNEASAGAFGETTAVLATNTAGRLLGVSPVIWVTGVEARVLCSWGVVDWA
jgi:hypothetical protein